VAFTPNVQTILDGVVAEFPQVRHGAWACRRIAGTITWSQHSWENAVDIFVSPILGDQVYSFIREEYAEHVKVILWRVKNHFDHVHVDPWPTGIATPPCKGGGLLVKHKDGKVGRIFTDDIPHAPPVPPPPPPDPVPSEEAMLPITKDSSQQDIGRLQDLINETYYAPFGQPGLTLDGIYGNGTAAAVRKWLLRYTNDTRPEVLEGRLVNFNQWNSLMRDWILVITR
jgi:hypothetical protein